MEVRDTKVASIDDVIQVLEKGKDADLTYEQQLAMQHAKKFMISKAKAEKIEESLKGMDILSETSIIKILEVMPKNNMTLRQILAQERKSFSDEQVNKILALIKEKG